MLLPSDPRECTRVMAELARGNRVEFKVGPKLLKAVPRKTKELEERDKMIAEQYNNAVNAESTPSYKYEIHTGICVGVLVGLLVGNIPGYLIGVKPEIILDRCIFETTAVVTIWAAHKIAKRFKLKI